MVNRIIKIAIAAGLLAFAVWEFYNGNIGNGIFLTLLIAFPILLIFRHERIILAFWFLRKQNFEKANVHLDKIKKPDELIKRQAAYWYYLKGLMDLNLSKDFSKAERLFRKSLDMGLKMGHDVAMAKINLASIAISKRRKPLAKRYIAEVKKMKEASMFKDQIKQIEMFAKRI